MIDTHAHWSEGWETTGLKAVVLAGSNVENSRQNVELAKESPKFYFAAIGIHPQETGDVADLEAMMDKNVVAIGECGLDFSAEIYDAQKQEIMFRKQIELAKKYDLPLIIHARKAVDETVEILKSYGKLRGVFHCYAGGKKRVNKVLDLGENWYFGIDGNLTYEVGLTDVAQCIPIERILLETDSPFLAPVPHRGETNQPTNVKFIYEFLSKLWEEDAETIVDNNAKKLFQIIF